MWYRSGEILLYSKFKSFTLEFRCLLCLKSVLFWLTSPPLCLVILNGPYLSTIDVYPDDNISQLYYRCVLTSLQRLLLRDSYYFIIWFYKTFLRYYTVLSGGDVCGGEDVPGGDAAHHLGAAHSYLLLLFDHWEAHCKAGITSYSPYIQKADKATDLQRGKYLYANLKNKQGLSKKCLLFPNPSPYIL